MNEKKRLLEMGVDTRTEAEILEALEARNKRLATMTPAEATELEQAIMDWSVAAYNFCRFGD